MSSSSKYANRAPFRLGTRTIVAAALRYGTARSGISLAAANRSYPFLRKRRTLRQVRRLRRPIELCPVSRNAAAPIEQIAAAVSGHLVTDGMLYRHFGDLGVLQSLR
jgi:hypothetical protein